MQSSARGFDYLNDAWGYITTTQYIYDENGNLISKTPQQITSNSGTENISLSLLGEITTEQLGYDMKVEQYAYNGFGQLTNAAVNDKLAEYAYNPDGLRVSKTVNGETTTHILDGANVVADVTSDNISKYNRGRELISIEQNGNKGYYTFNGHGDVTQLVDGNGQTKNYYEFTAFGYGSVEQGIGEFQNPFGHAGEYTDLETGNIYLRARYYNPTDGRFISEDPIKDGANWYAYCGNNPVMMVDPWGLKGMLTRPRDDGEMVAEQIRCITGDSGYSFDDKSREIVWKDNGEIDGGSEVMRKIIHSLITNENIVMQILVDKEGNPEDSSFSNGVLWIKGAKYKELLTGVLIHEFNHAYSYYNQLKSHILYNFTDKSDIIGNSERRAYIEKQYEEALAITIEQQARKDLGLPPRETVVDPATNMIGVNNYGQFPYTITHTPEQNMVWNGNTSPLYGTVQAAIIRCYAQDIVSYILINGSDGH